MTVHSIAIALTYAWLAGSLVMTGYILAVVALDGRRGGGR